MAAGRQEGFDWTRSGLAFAGGALGGALGQAAYDKTCFRAGTPLVWEHGYRKVEEFQVGDRLAARSEFDPEGAIEWKAIEEVFVRRGLILEVTVAGQTIGTTAEHPFYLHGKGWTPAGELAVGDLLAAADGSWLPVEKLYNTGALETVYNFRVADHHTYFVGDHDWAFSVWAHNAKCAVSAKPIDGTRPRHGSKSHDATAFNIALGWEVKPNTVKARFNQALVDVKGNEISGLRPDAQRIRRTKSGLKIDVVEVQSKGQSDAFMDRKIAIYRRLLGSQAGTIKWIAPVDATRS